MPDGATMGEVYAQHVIPAAIDCAREILARMAIDRHIAARRWPASVARPSPATVRRCARTGWRSPGTTIPTRSCGASAPPVRGADRAWRPAGERLRRAPHDVEDAWVRPRRTAAQRPGRIVAHRDGAVLVATGAGGAVWIGHAKVKPEDGGRG